MGEEVPPAAHVGGERPRVIEALGQFARELVTHRSVEPRTRQLVLRVDPGPRFHAVRVLQPPEGIGDDDSVKRFCQRIDPRAGVPERHDVSHYNRWL